MCGQVHAVLWRSGLWLADEGAGFATGPPRPSWELRSASAGGCAGARGWRLSKLSPHLTVLSPPGGPPGESGSHSEIKVGSLDKAAFAMGSRVSLESAESAWASLAGGRWPELCPACISDLVCDPVGKARPSLGLSLLTG